MKIRCEDLETAVSNWHPDQWVNLYDFTGVYYSTCQVKNINPDMDDADFAEPTTIDGQPAKPKLKPQKDALDE